MSVSNSSSIAWKPIIGLASLQGAITLTWVIYNLYIPQLLVQLGFPAIAGLYLLAIENLLAALIEPLMGLVSDRVKTWLGIRFPWVILGTLLSAFIFVLLPWAGNFDRTTILRWLLPIGAIVWAMAMAIFRAPVLSLLGSYAERSYLPQAASWLTLTSLLAGYLSQPVHSKILKDLGAVGAFGLGSLSLIVAVLVFSLCQPPARQPPIAPPEPQAQLFQQPAFSKSQLFTLLWMGIGIGIGTAFLRRMLSPAEATQLLAWFTASHLITVLPAGWLAKRWGNHRCLLVGLGVVATLMAVFAMLNQALHPIVTHGLAIALGLSFSFVLNGILPFVLTQAPKPQAGFATGAYFGGTAIAGTLVNSLYALELPLPKLLTHLLGPIAFLIASLFIIQNRIQFRQNLQAGRPLH
jgi:Na+/melibiose symporter-like transporter